MTTALRPCAVNVLKMYVGASLVIDRCMQICVPRIKGVVETVSDLSPVHTKLHAPCVVLLSTIQPAFRGWVETLVLFSCAANHESSINEVLLVSIKIAATLSPQTTHVNL